MEITKKAVHYVYWHILPWTPETCGLHIPTYTTLGKIYLPSVHQDIFFSLWVNSSLGSDMSPIERPSWFARKRSSSSCVPRSNNGLDNRHHTYQSGRPRYRLRFGNAFCRWDRKKEKKRRNSFWYIGHMF